MTFSYFYTLVNAAPGEMTQHNLTDDLRPIFQVILKSKPHVAVFRENNVESVYIFRAKDGSDIGKLTFAPGQY